MFPEGLLLLDVGFLLELKNYGKNVASEVHFKIITYAGIPHVFNLCANFIQLPAVTL